MGSLLERIQHRWNWKRNNKPNKRQTSKVGDYFGIQALKVSACPQAQTTDKGGRLTAVTVTAVLPFLLGRSNYPPHLPPRRKNIQSANQHVRHYKIYLCVGSQMEVLRKKKPQQLQDPAFCPRNSESLQWKQAEDSVSEMCWTKHLTRALKQGSKLYWKSTW